MSQPLFMIVFSYLVIINIIAIVITIVDKRKAQKQEWRIPEKTLLIVAALGGSASMYMTMQIIRHKTRHAKFMIGIPLIAVLQLAAVVLIFKFIFKA